MTETERELLGLLERTPAGQELIAKKKQGDFAARQELVVDKEQRQAETEKRMPRLIQLRDAAQAKMLAAEAKATAAAEESRAAAAAVASLSHSHASHVAAIDRKLIESSDPAIEEARQKLFADIEQMRQRGLKSWEEKTGRFLGKLSSAEMKQCSNRDELLSVMTKMTEAAAQLEELKLKNPENVEQAIDDILADLPSVNDFVG